MNTQARDVTSDNATVEFCEQEGNDGCDSNHESERVAWLAVDPGIIERQPGFDFGNFTKGDSNWQGVSFSQDFSEKPMVIADVQTENGNQEALYPEVNSVGTDGASIRFCESEGYDDCDTHDTEEIAWMAIAPGNVSINATGRSLCDERGPRNECISNTVHEIDSEFYNISSVFQTRRSSVFSALTERATIKVENSSEISGFWNGSFNITSQETTIKPGAEFKPRNGRIIIG